MKFYHRVCDNKNTEMGSKMVKGYKWATFVPLSPILLVNGHQKSEIRNQMEGVVGHQNRAPENDDRLIHLCHKARNVKCKCHLNLINHVKGRDPICDCTEFGEV